MLSAIAYLCLLVSVPWAAYAYVEDDFYTDFPIAVGIFGFVCASVLLFMGARSDPSLNEDTSDVQPPQLIEGMAFGATAATIVGLLLLWVLSIDIGDGVEYSSSKEIGLFEDVGLFEKVAQYGVGILIVYIGRKIWKCSKGSKPISSYVGPAIAYVLLVPAATVYLSLAARTPSQYWTTFLAAGMVHVLFPKVVPTIKEQIGRTPIRARLTVAVSMLSLLIVLS